MNIGSHIRSLRLEKGLTAVELATRAGISQSYLSQVETGKAGSPSTKMIGKLAAGLGIDRSELMFDIGYVNPRFVNRRGAMTEQGKRAVHAAAAVNADAQDLEKLLKSESEYHYKYKLLTKEDKEKLIVVLDTFFS